MSNLYEMLTHVHFSLTPAGRFSAIVWMNKENNNLCECFWHWRYREWWLSISSTYLTLLSPDFTCCIFRQQNWHCKKWKWIVTYLKYEFKTLTVAFSVLRSWYSKLTWHIAQVWVNSINNSKKWWVQNTYCCFFLYWDQQIDMTHCASVS